MKVYIGYSCYYDYCNVWEKVEKVFDEETKAFVWVEEFPKTETDWRTYEEYELE